MHQQEVIKDSQEKIAIAAEADGEIRFSWIERDEDDLSRRGTMYCFKSCSVNNN